MENYNIFPNISILVLQQKKTESPLDSTNPFLEEEPGEDLATEKDEDLTKVSSQHLNLNWSAVVTYCDESMVASLLTYASSYIIWYYC